MITNCITAEKCCWLRRVRWKVLGNNINCMSQTPQSFPCSQVLFVKFSPETNPWEPVDSSGNTQREKPSQQHSIQTFSCLTHLYAPQCSCFSLWSSMWLTFLFFSLCLLALSELNENRSPPYTEPIGGLSGLKRAESKWGSQRGRENRRD